MYQKSLIQKCIIFKFASYIKFLFKYYTKPTLSKIILNFIIFHIMFKCKLYAYWVRMCWKKTKTYLNKVKIVVSHLFIKQIYLTSIFFTTFQQKMYAYKYLKYLRIYSFFLLFYSKYNKYFGTIYHD